ncbi:hypothetical protein [uncultured Stenotrophomonas sp.]|uniref:hypothetical protein n=1 Tax=uncultured Stenotrophomonas sp. TaxID=165438 RepID=UPI0025FE24E6|nr:hypothetical protein [uncultured Stenotrophomonas sp.]
MFVVILLMGQNRYARERWEQLPEVVEYEGLGFTLRAGPRQPQATTQVWEPVAIYAPHALTEDEFREIYELNRHHIVELSLEY